jgi:predicted esterase
MLPISVQRCALLAIACACACSSSSSTSGGGSGSVEALFVVPSSLDDLHDEHFLDHPWPSDLRKDPDGSVHFAGFYNPHDTIILNDYLAAAKGLLHGFSTAAAGHFRFTGDIDESTLPASPQAATDPHASVQIVDVDPQSPERGKHRVVETFWRRDPGVYWLPLTLAVMPALGAPLRPKTRYAFVVTRALRSSSGSPIAPSADLAEVLGQAPPTPRTQAARDLFGPALDELEKAGVARADVAHLAVMTTEDPTAELFAVADSVRQDVPAPSITSPIVAKETTGAYDVYEGRYGPSPNYQAGKIPFAQKEDGGGFVFDASGKPTLQGTFDLRFSLVIPNAQKCPAPASGYPVVLYAHGTGGDYRSMIGDGTSNALAGNCLASMGIDQIFHGDRPGAPPLLPDGSQDEGKIELLFFNLNNIIAARTNGRQAAIDVIQQARVFSEAHVQVPAAVSKTGQAISIDPTKIMFFGHSQGGLNGPLYLAADPSARGGVLSGAGSMITIALLEKTKPTPSVAQAVKTVLSLISPDEQAELNALHPVMSLAQTLIDTVDPVNYDGYIVQHPRGTNPPKSVYETEGVNADGTGDSYAPPHGIEIGAAAIGLPREAPGIHAIEEDTYLDLGDATVGTGGLAGNLAGGKASGILAQFTPAPSSDGHFVVFDVPAARAQAAGFLKNLAADPAGRVPGQ